LSVLGLGTKTTPTQNQTASNSESHSDLNWCLNNEQCIHMSFWGNVGNSVAPEWQFRDYYHTYQNASVSGCASRPWERVSAKSDAPKFSDPTYMINAIAYTIPECSGWHAKYMLNTHKICTYRLLASLPVRTGTPSGKTISISCDIQFEIGSWKRRMRRARKFLPLATKRSRQKSLYAAASSGGTPFPKRILESMISQMALRNFGFWPPRRVAKAKCTYPDISFWLSAKVLPWEVARTCWSHGKLKDIQSGPRACAIALGRQVGAMFVACSATHLQKKWSRSSAHRACPMQSVHEGRGMICLQKLQPG
jgi:hypothetical protein